MRRFYYYGCRGSQSGHYIHGTGSAHADRLDGGFPVHILDGTFAPLDTNTTAWKLTQLRFAGHVVSILACHDNTIDKRPGSNAAFIAIDSVPWDETDMLNEASRAFPDCRERLQTRAFGAK